MPDIGRSPCPWPQLSVRLRPRLRGVLAVLLARAQQLDALDHPTGPGLRVLRALDPQHVGLPVAVRQTVEERPYGRLGVHRLGEVLGYGEFARLGVERELHVDLVACA